MPRLITLILALCFASPTVALGSNEVATKRLLIRFDAKPLATLIYHLDCLAQIIYCEPTLVRKFWEKRQWRPADMQLVHDWGALMDGAFRKGAEIPGPSTAELRAIGFPLRHDNISYEKKIRIAGLEAESIPAYQRAIAPYMNETETLKAGKILRHFEPRLRNWWEKSGKTMAQKFITDFVAEMKTKDIAPLVEKIADFYEADISTGNPLAVHFVLMEGRHGHSSGEQLEDHSLAEIQEGERPSDRMDVICHELFHHFYRAAPIRKHMELVKAFTSSQQADAIVAYNLLNEGLATAFGNGLIDQKLRGKIKPHSWYNDVAIDTTAKALLPDLEKRLASHSTLYSDTFVLSYLKTVSSAIPSLRVSPALFLRTHVGNFENQLRPAYRVFDRKIRAGSTWSGPFPDVSETLTKMRDYPHLSTLLLVTPPQASLLDPLIEQIGEKSLARIKQRALKGESFLHIQQRGRHGQLIVLVATPDNAEAWLDKIAKARSFEELK